MRNLQELPSMAAAVSKVRSWRPLRRVLTEWLAALAASRITRPELAKALRWDAAAALGFAKKGNRAALEIYLAAVAEVIALTAYIAPPPWSLQRREKLSRRALQCYKLPLLVDDGKPVITPRRLQHLTFREKARVHHAIQAFASCGLQGPSQFRFCRLRAGRSRSSVSQKRERNRERVRRFRLRHRKPILPKEVQTNFLDLLG